MVHDGTLVRSDAGPGHESRLGGRPRDELTTVVVWLGRGCIGFGELKRHVHWEGFDFGVACRFTRRISLE